MFSIRRNTPRFRLRKPLLVIQSAFMLLAFGMSRVDIARFLGVDDDTVAHPFHPLQGQVVQVLGIYHRQPESTLFVQTSQGDSFCIAVSATDYEGTSAAVDPVHRLTW